jgi:SAM-dependent methyltransferase
VKFTGERVIPGEGDLDVFNEHRARYRFAQRYSSGKTVLDAACGSGYGSALMGENAKAVFGVDISLEAVEYARSHYESAKVHFGQSDCLALPFPSGKFDLVAAFEIIEHLQQPEGFLQELCRVLTPSGLLILSTPNRLYYTEERGATNPFHYREFSFPEFDEILQPLFPHRAILLENHVPGLLLSAPDAAPDFSSPSGPGILQEEAVKAEAEEKEKAAHYFVALCSRQPLAPVSPLLYLPSSGNVLREREIHIGLLTGYLAAAKTERDQARTHVEAAQAHIAELNSLLEERTRWARDLDQQLTEKAAYLLQLQADYDSKVQWALSLQQDVEKAREALERLQKEFEERTAWALRLDAELKEMKTWALRLDAELMERNADLQILYGSKWYRIGKNLRLSPIPPSDQH